MSLTCKICKRAENFNEYVVREMLYGTREKFDYFQCSRCGCLQIKEFPRDLAQYYPDNYYSKNINFEEMVKERKVKRNIESLNKYLSSPAASRLSFKDLSLNIIPHLKMKKNDRIPVVGYDWEKYGVNCYQLDAPRHLFLHSKDSMMFLADKAGLKVDKIKYDSTSSQFINSENYQKGIPLIQEVPKSKGFQRIKGKYKKWKYKRMSAYLNNTMNGDQAACILAKL